MYDITQHCLPGVVLLQPIHTYLVLPYSTSWDLYLAIRHLGKPPLFPAPKTPVRNDGLQIGEGWQCRERIGDIQDHAVPCEAIASLEMAWKTPNRHQGQNKKKQKCSREKKHKKSVWLMFCKGDHVAFFLSGYTNRCRTVHSDKESSWKIPSNSGVCRGWLHFTNPKSGQFGRFPDSKPTFFEASLQQTQMLHNFSKHSWNKQFSGESIRVFKIPAPSFHRWWPRNSTPRPCIGSIWDLEEKEFIRPLEEIPKQPLFGCIKPRNNGTFTISTGAGFFFHQQYVLKKWQHGISAIPADHRKKWMFRCWVFTNKNDVGRRKKNHLVKLCSRHL